METSFLWHDLALRWTHQGTVFCSDVCPCNFTEGKPWKKKLQWLHLCEEKQTVYNVWLCSVGVSLNLTWLCVRTKKKKESSAVLIHLACHVKLYLDKAVYTILYKQAVEQSSNIWCRGCAWPIICVWRLCHVLSPVRGSFNVFHAESEATLLHRQPRPSLSLPCLNQSSAVLSADRKMKQHFTI